ncbi:hypothetical protein [Paenibacillus sp. J2TS4]|uniref:hypothetical protein n=1 Tax=Paenibacillus sp. J2TS4 TaxID=2807194 RepID=UPI001B09903F|nr:hypothetical protein [Paenibacillus sp. J2TS4]GIP32003.1 hypothetical protein J2TS4_12130 [Paenibacillus sp. J2TS4]
MSDKVAVHFRKTRTTAHLFQRIKHCRKCGNYSCLWDDRCLSCGAERCWIDVPEMVQAVQKHRAQTSMLFIGTIGAAAFLLARNTKEMALALIGTAVLLTLYALLSKQFKSIIYRRTLSRLVLHEMKKIREGLLLDIGDAEKDFKAGDKKTAYEKFREIGYFINDDSIKLLKVYCLNHFVIRSDMNLELASLLPGQFNKDFVRYMHEVGKVRPQLFTREVLDYVLKYCSAIEALPEGPHVLTAAAGAALRVKGYLRTYRQLLLERAVDLPKERLLRLCRMLAESQEYDAELTATVRHVVKLKFASDPEFQGIL